METNISPLGMGMGVLAARAQAEVDREALAPSIEISALGISTHGILSPRDLSIHGMLSPRDLHP